jgi:hypothetical protein
MTYYFDKNKTFEDANKLFYLSCNKLSHNMIEFVHEL